MDTLFILFIAEKPWHPRLALYIGYSKNKLKCMTYLSYSIGILLLEDFLGLLLQFFFFFRILGQSWKAWWIPLQIMGSLQFGLSLLIILLIGIYICRMASNRKASLALLIMCFSILCSKSTKIVPL